MSTRVTDGERRAAARCSSVASSSIRRGIGQAAENFAIVRKVVLNLLKRDSDKKTSLVSKRLKAAWNKHYLINLLSF
jgi:hypothetical protein